MTEMELLTQQCLEEVESCRKEEVVYPGPCYIEIGLVRKLDGRFVWSASTNHWNVGSTSCFSDHLTPEAALQELLKLIKENNETLYSKVSPT